MKDVQALTGIHLLTAEKLEGYKIVEYYGLVSGQSIMGANFIKDFFARIADTFGGRVSGYERALDGAMGVALEQMALRASKKGANAVIAIDIDTGAMGGRMLMASCYGTAVLIEPDRHSS
jgi:uncharacterized protein YbjQ (UPF0145 family)